jgi:hypothetical protein
VTNPVFRFATVQGQNIQWFLRRNCSVSPRQLGWMYLSLCAVSLAIGAAFWFQGAKLVLPFAWIELVAVGIAFAAYARHATDGETIRLAGGNWCRAGEWWQAGARGVSARMGQGRARCGRQLLDRAVGQGARCKWAVCAA